MGVDLALKGVEARFKQEALLLFELDFDAQGVPDLERDADVDGRAEPDEHLEPRDVGDKRKKAMGVGVGDPFAADLQDDDEKQHQESGGRSGAGAGCGAPSARG